MRRDQKAEAPRGRGRPRRLWPTLDDEMLASATEVIANTIYEKGHKNPIGAALKEVAELHERKPFETIKRYYYRGLEKLAPAEERALCRFEEIKRGFDGRHGEYGNAEATLALVSELGSTIFMVNRILERARRRRQRATTRRI